MPNTVKRRRVSHSLTTKPQTQSNCRFNVLGLKRTAPAEGRWLASFTAYENAKAERAHINLNKIERGSVKASFGAVRLNVKQFDDTVIILNVRLA
jgi:hypothetical protein